MVYEILMIALWSILSVAWILSCFVSICNAQEYNKRRAAYELVPITVPVLILIAIIGYFWPIMLMAAIASLAIFIPLQILWSANAKSLNESEEN